MSTKPPKSKATGTSNRWMQLLQEGEKKAGAWVQQTLCRSDTPDPFSFSELMAAVHRHCLAECRKTRNGPR